MALGDTAQSLDPIGGQGANNGNKMARNLVECVVEREDRPFDADWMRATFDRFWQRHRYIDMFNNTLLEPLTTAGKLLLLAQFGSTARPGATGPAQHLADAFCENFDDPMRLTEAFHDQAKAKQILRREFGSWLRPVLAGALRVGRGQLRQATGRPANHPGMVAGGGG
jgi:2-polyprenyl-6-methoxyphenol hydroxylase-like FAD-dependent oxidoreductase